MKPGFASSLELVDSGFEVILVWGQESEFDGHYGRGEMIDGSCREHAEEDDS
jgi:hypothetical protein